MTIHLPEQREWWTGTEPGTNPDLTSPAAQHMKHDDPVEGCPGCAVGPMFKVVAQAVWVDGEFLDETWELQDGYGEPGYTPDQGWDWSGIRDSSPAAIARMYEAVTGKKGVT